MLYPYKFQPILVERVWGGDALGRFGKSVRPGQRIGESWEISDRIEAQSIVSNGPLQGQTLHDLVASLGSQLVGTNAEILPGTTGPGRFPLLIKLLDARDRLSLQVHPPADVAARLGGEPKTEMWYVLETEPHAHLIAGLRDGVTRYQFEEALRDSPIATQQSKIENYVHRFPVLPGESFFVPSGRIHAIDAGVVLAEIQQNSDTTYRVYDWGRAGLDGKLRKLHVPEALACIDFQDFEPRKIEPMAEYRDVNGLWRLVDCPCFCVHQYRLRNAAPERCDGGSFHILGCVAGKVGIFTSNNPEETLRCGEFALVPAGLGYYTLTPLEESTRVLKVFLPARQEVAI